jgi:hypothetical protein
MAKERNVSMPAKRQGVKVDEQSQQELAERDRSRVSQQDAKDKDEAVEELSPDDLREADDDDELGGESEPG